MLYDYLRRFSRGASRLHLKSWQTGYRHDTYQRVPHTTENAENSSGETASSPNSQRYPSGSQGERSSDPANAKSNGPWPPKTQNAFYPHEKKFDANPNAGHHDQPPDSSRCYPGSNVQAPHWIQHPRPSLPAMINIPRVPDPHPGGSSVIYAGPGLTEPYIQTASKKASDSVISFVDGSYKIVESGKAEKRSFDLGSQLIHGVHECEPSICGSIKIETIEGTDAQPGRAGQVVAAEDPRTISSYLKSEIKPEFEPVSKLPEEYVPVGQLRTEPVQVQQMQAGTPERLDQSQSSGTTAKPEVKPSAERSTNNGEFQTEQARKDIQCESWKVSELAESVQQAHSPGDFSGGENGAAKKPSADSGQVVLKSGYLQAECVPFQANRQLTLALTLNSASQEVQASSSGLKGCQATTELSAQPVQQVPCATFSEFPEQLPRTDEVLKVPLCANAVSLKSNVTEAVPTSANTELIQTTQQRGVGDEAIFFSCQYTGDQIQRVNSRFDEKEESTRSVVGDENKTDSEAALEIWHRRSVESPKDSMQQQVIETSSVSHFENQFGARALMDEIHSFQEKTVRDYEDTLKSPFWNASILNNQQMIKEDFPRVEELMSKILTMKEKVTKQNEEVTKSLLQEISSMKVELTQEIAALRAKMGEASIAQKPAEGFEQMKKELLNEIAAVKNVSFQNVARLAEKSVKEMRLLKEELTKEISGVKVSGKPVEENLRIKELIKDKQQRVVDVERPTKEISALREDIAREIKDQSVENKMMLEKPLKEIMRMSNELLKEIAIVKDKANQNYRFVEKPAKELAALKDALIKKMAAIEATIAQNFEASRKPAKSVEKMKEDLMKEMVTIKDVLVNKIETSKQVTETAAMKAGLVKDMASNKQGSLKDIGTMKNELMKEMAVIKQNVLQNKEAAQKTNQEIATIKGNTAIKGLIKKMASIDAKIAQSIESSMQPAKYVIKLKEDLMKEMAAIKNIVVHNNEMLQSGTEITGKIANRGDNVQNYTVVKENPVTEIATMKNELMREIAVINKNVLQNNEKAQKPLQEIATMKGDLKEMAAVKADLTQNNVASKPAKEIATMKEDSLKEIAAIKVNLAQNSETGRNPAKDVEKMKEDLTKVLEAMKTSTVETYKMATEKPGREIEKMEENLLKEIADMKASTIQNYEMAKEIPVREIATMKDEMMKEMAAMKSDTIESYAMVTEKPVHEIVTMKNELMKEMAVIKEKVLQNNESVQKPVKEIVAMTGDIVNQIAAMKADLIQKNNLSQRPFKEIAKMKEDLMKEIASMKKSTIQNFKVAVEKPVKDIATMKGELMKEMEALKTSTVENYKMAELSDRLLASIKDQLMKEMAMIQNKTTENCALAAGKSVKEIAAMKSELMKEMASIKDGITKRSVGIQGHNTHIVDMNVGEAAVPRETVTENTVKFAEPVPDMLQVENDLMKELESFKKLTIQNALSAAVRMKEILSVKEQLNSTLMNKTMNENTLKAFVPNNVESVQVSAGTSEMLHRDQSWPRSQSSLEMVDSGDRCSLTGHCEIPYHLLRLQKERGDSKCTKPPGFGKSPFPPLPPKSKKSAGRIDEGRDQAEPKEEVDLERNSKRKTVNRPAERRSPSKGRPPLKGAPSSSDTNAKSPTNSSKRPSLCFPSNSSSSCNSYSTNLSSGEIPPGKGPTGPESASSAQIKNEIAAMKANTIENCVMALEYPFEEFSKMGDELAREMTAIQNLTIENYLMASGKGEDFLYRSSKGDELAREVTTMKNLTIENYLMAAGKGEGLLHRRSRASGGPLNVDLPIQHSRSDSDHSTSTDLQKTVQSSSPISSSSLIDKEIASMINITLENYIMARENGFEEISKWKEDFARETSIENTVVENYMVAAENPFLKMESELAMETGVTENFVMGVEEPKSMDLPYASSLSSNTPVEAKSALESPAAICPSSVRASSSSEPPIPISHPSPSRRSSSCCHPRSSSCGFPVVQCRPPPHPCPPLCLPPCPPPCQPSCPPTCPPPCRSTCPTSTCGQASNNDFIKNLKKGVVPIQESKIRDYFSTDANITPSLEIRAAGCPCPPSKPDNINKLPPENSKRPSIIDKPSTTSGTSGDKPQRSSDNGGDKPPDSSGGRNKKTGKPPGISSPGGPGSKPSTRPDSPVRMERFPSSSAYNVPTRSETLSVIEISKTPPLSPSGISGHDPYQSDSLSVGENSVVSSISPGSIGSTQPHRSGGIIDNDFFPTSNRPAGGIEFTAKSTVPKADSGSNTSRRRPCNPSNRPFFVRSKPPPRPAFDDQCSHETHSISEDISSVTLRMGGPQGTTLSQSDNHASLDNSHNGPLSAFGTDKMESSDSTTFKGNLELPNEGNRGPVRPDDPQNMRLSSPGNVSSLANTGIEALNEDGSNKTKSSDISTAAWSLELENKDNRSVRPGSSRGTPFLKTGNTTSWDKPSVNNLNSAGCDDSAVTTDAGKLELGDSKNKRPCSPQNTSPSRSDIFTSREISDIRFLSTAGIQGSKSSDGTNLTGNLETEGNREGQRRQSSTEVATLPLSTPRPKPDTSTSLGSPGISTVETVGNEKPMSSDSSIVAGNLVTASKPAEWDEKGTAKARFSLPGKQGQTPDPGVETNLPSKSHKHNVRLSGIDAQESSNRFSDRLSPKPQDMIWRVTSPFNFLKLNGEDPRENAEVSESKSSSILKETGESKVSQDLRGLRQRETQVKKTDPTPGASESEDVVSKKVNPPEHDSGKLIPSKDNLPVVSEKAHPFSQEGGSAKTSISTATDLPSVQLATILLLSRAAESSRIRMNKPVSKDPAHKKGKSGHNSSRNSAGEAAHRRASSPSATLATDNSGRYRNTIDVTYNEGLASTDKEDTTELSSQSQKPWSENSVQRQNEILSKLANLPVEKGGQSDRTTRLASLSQTNFDAAYFLRECALSKPRHSSIFSKDYVDDNIANTDKHSSKGNKSTDWQQDEKLDVAASSPEQLQTSGQGTNTLKIPSAVSLQVLTKQQVAEHNKMITEHERKISAVREKHLKLKYIKEKYKTEEIPTPGFSWKQQLRALLPDPEAVDRAIAEVLSFETPRRSPLGESTENSLDEDFKREIVKTSAKDKSSKLRSEYQDEIAVEILLKDGTESAVAKVLSGEMQSRPHRVNEAKVTNSPRKLQQLISLLWIPKQTEKTSKSLVKTSFDEPKYDTSTASVPNLSDQISNNKETKVYRTDKVPPKIKQYRPRFNVSDKQEINEPSIESQSRIRSCTTLPPQVIQILQSGKVDTQSKGQQSVPPTPKKPSNAFPKFKGPTISSGSLTPKKPSGKSLHTAVSSESRMVLHECEMSCKSYSTTQALHALGNSPTKKKQSGPPGCPCAENMGPSPPGDSSDGGNSTGGSRRTLPNDGSLPMKVKDGLNTQMVTEMGAFLRYFKMSLHNLREISENSSDVMTSKYVTKLFLREQTESINEISRLLTNAQRVEASPREIQTYDESLYARYKED